MTLERGGATTNIGWIAVKIHGVALNIDAAATKTNEMATAVDAVVMTINSDRMKISRLAANTYCRELT